LGTPAGARASQGDLDGDGDVDRADVARLAVRFGVRYVPPASPSASPAAPPSASDSFPAAAQPPGTARQRVADVALAQWRLAERTAARLTVLERRSRRPSIDGAMEPEPPATRVEAVPQGTLRAAPYRVKSARNR
jgi:hypothetical protein